MALNPDLLLAMAPGGIVDLSGPPSSFVLHIGLPVSITWSNVILLSVLALVFLAGLLVPLFPGRAERIAANAKARKGDQ